MPYSDGNTGKGVFSALRPLPPSLPLMTRRVVLDDGLS